MMLYKFQITHFLTHWPSIPPTKYRYIQVNLKDFVFSQAWKCNREWFMNLYKFIKLIKSFVALLVQLICSSHIWIAFFCCKHVLHGQGSDLPLPTDRWFHKGWREDLCCTAVWSMPGLAKKKVAPEAGAGGYWAYKMLRKRRVRVGWALTCTAGLWKTGSSTNCCEMFSPWSSPLPLPRPGTIWQLPSHYFCLTPFLKGYWGSAYFLWFSSESWFKMLKGKQITCNQINIWPNTFSSTRWFKSISQINDVCVCVGGVGVFSPGQGRWPKCIYANRHEESSLHQSHPTVLKFNPGMSTVVHPAFSPSLHLAPQRSVTGGLGLPGTCTQMWILPFSSGPTFHSQSKCTSPARECAHQTTTSEQRWWATQMYTSYIRAFATHFK